MEYGVEPITFVQYVGDLVIVPACVPHQVLNVNSTIKMALDFVSPYNAEECLLNLQRIESVPNRFDYLRVKRALHLGVLRALATLRSAETETREAEEKRKKAEKEALFHKEKAENLEKTLQKTKEDADSEILVWKRRAEEARSAERALKEENDALRGELEELRRKHTKKTISVSTSIDSVRPTVSSLSPDIPSASEESLSGDTTLSPKEDTKRNVSMEDFDLHSAVSFAGEGVRRKNTLKCDNCERFFVQKKDLEDHKQKQECRTIVCGYCKWKCCNKEEMDKHRKQHSCMCTICRRNFSCKSSLYRHMDSCHKK